MGAVRRTGVAVGVNIVLYVALLGAERKETGGEGSRFGGRKLCFAPSMKISSRI